MSDRSEPIYLKFLGKTTPQRSTDIQRQAPRGEVPSRRRPAVADLLVRASLIPKLLMETFFRPVSDFTLVRRNGRVFIVKKGADLTGADLTGAYLRRANLEETRLENALLVGANLEEANLANANLRNADLSRANLRNANLTGANLSGCNFRYADLWGARVNPEALSQAATLDGALLGSSSPHG
jgi:hypothetical protein